MPSAPALVVQRRTFLVRSGALLGGAALAGLPACRDDGEVEPAPRLSDPSDWQQVRHQFALSERYRHLAAFVMAAHPAPVRSAIERHRRGLDENTRIYMAENEGAAEEGVLAAAAEYLDTSADQIALTDSTTMGLGLLYGGFDLGPGREVLTTEHDFYATHESLRLRAARTGAAVRRIRLYEDIASVSADEIVGSIRDALTRRTRVLALTWVHSSTGLKLPIRAIADALADENGRRDDRDRVLLCVDGVHGFGVEDETPETLGCDFLVSGCHKWLFGPRGTGLVWGASDAWAAATAIIPTFDVRSIIAWIESRTPEDVPPGPTMTPGGFHSFEHRWALADAFRFHLDIGRSRIARRTHDLSARLKAGLGEMPHVRVITPAAEELSSGIVCVDVVGRPPDDIVDRLLAEHRIVASVTPYADRYVRLGPSIVTLADDVDAVVAAFESFA